MVSAGTVNSAFLALWGKTSRDEATPEAWHPLIGHLLDTLAVARCWVVGYAPRSVLRGAAEGLGWDEDTLVAVLPALVALHDLGKASLAFQMKWAPAWDLLGQAGLAPRWRAPVPPLLPAHGALGVLLISAGLVRRLGWPAVRADAVARCLGAHHGMPVTQTEQEIKEGLDWGATPANHPAWSAARKALVDTVLDLGLPDGADLPSPQISAVGQIHLLGATTVIDWVASQEDVFGFAHPGTEDWGAFDPVRYLEESATLGAEKAIARAGFSRRRRPSGPPARRFAELFPDYTPTPIQDLADDLLAAAEDQFLLVVEDAMGQGKTEVAFEAIATARGMDSQGCYLALPTRATSNQAFDRLREFLEKHLRVRGEQLHLLHATAWMRDVGQAPQLTDGRDENDRAAGLAAGEWFAGPKRGLLGEHAVGTVDQVMLGVLTVRHHWVRLWGLAGKAVVLDEVHAYDTYMTTIIERLLEWLGALGCSVTLLSATLPTARRDALIAAFGRGAGWNAASPVAAGYPRVEWRSRAGGASRSPSRERISTRPLRLEWCGQEPAQIAERAVAAFRDGGCVGVVCNTVRRAQEVYAAVAERLSGFADDGHPAVHLFTSRFRADHRADIEDLVLRRYGKPGPGVQRPRGAVLVATQVIEQSLDIDFDLMISEFAPSDLLLQRAGRMHRHTDRTRPAGLTEPVLLVTRPGADKQDSPVFESGSVRVYDEHVLVRSRAALGDLPRDLVLPGDIDLLVQATYADGATPPPWLVEAWERTLTEFEDRRSLEHASAWGHLISTPDTDPYTVPSSLWNPDDEPPDATTRLGADGTQLVVIDPDERHLLQAYQDARVAYVQAKRAGLSELPEEQQHRLREARRDLMMRSLNVPPWWRPAGAETPPLWRTDATLRRAVLVETDALGGLTDANGVTWHYDRERGWAHD